MAKNKNQQRSTNDNQQNIKKTSSSNQDFDRLAQQADEGPKRKPGSQSNSSKQGNNGRGGGK